MSKSKIILFYKFIDLADPKAVMAEQKAIAKSLNLKGRMIIGEEGINGTFEGKPEDVDKYKEFMWNDSRFSDLVFKESEGEFVAFPKLQIRVRDEIVALNAGKFDPKTETATELTAEELESWYENGEEFEVLDLRNSYEIACGQFDRTIDPGLQNFRDLPKKLDELKKLKNKKLVTVCTGGIRCEKATCLLKREGFTDVYQLKDGIHTYMQQYPGKHFKGTLFVFDNRMVTDVVPIPNKEVIGKCKYCGTKTEQYYSDDTTRPSTKVICCDSCYEDHKSILREVVTLK